MKYLVETFDDRAFNFQMVFSGKVIYYCHFIYMAANYYVPVIVFQNIDIFINCLEYQKFVRTRGHSLQCFDKTVVLKVTKTRFMRRLEYNSNNRGSWVGLPKFPDF